MMPVFEVHYFTLCSGFLHSLNSTQNMLRCIPQASILVELLQEPLIMPFDSTPTLYAHRLGEIFEKTSAQHDAQNTFVDENYDVLKQEKLFSAMVPNQLGGMGVSYSEMCSFLRCLLYTSPSPRD